MNTRISDIGLNNCRYNKNYNKNSITDNTYISENTDISENTVMTKCIMYMINGLAEYPETYILFDKLYCIMFRVM